MANILKQSKTYPDWGTDPITTRDHVLRRKCTVTSGDIDGTDSFDPAVEFLALGQLGRQAIIHANLPDIRHQPPGTLIDRDAVPSIQDRTRIQCR